MGSRDKGRILKILEMHGLTEERRVCESCFWFLREGVYGVYPEFFCLKWGKEVDPEDSCKYSFRRDHLSKYNKLIEILKRMEKGQEGRNHGGVIGWLRKHGLNRLASELEQILEQSVTRPDYEEYVYVLDFLPYGYPEDRKPIHKRKPLAQVIGEKYFTLLEVSIKKGQQPLPLERLYVGKGYRDVVDKVKRKLRYSQLTESAKSNLPYALEHIVRRQEQRFLRIFNEGDWIQASRHKPLHLLHSLAYINNNVLQKILEYREKKFESFIEVPGIDPVRAIVNRIIRELIG